MPNAGKATTDVPPPNELELLRAFVGAHSQPDPRSGTREPIMYLTARKGTADFDLTAAGPYKTAKAVELLI